MVNQVMSKYTITCSQFAITPYTEVVP